MSKNLETEQFYTCLTLGCWFQVCRGTHLGNLAITAESFQHYPARCCDDDDDDEEEEETEVAGYGVMH